MRQRGHVGRSELSSERVNFFLDDRQVFIFRQAQIVFALQI